MMRWISKYPDLNIGEELARLVNWMIKNPCVMHLDLFVERWMERTAHYKRTGEFLK